MHITKAETFHSGLKITNNSKADLLSKKPPVFLLKLSGRDFQAEPLAAVVHASVQELKKKFYKMLKSFLYFFVCSLQHNRSSPKIKLI